MNNDNRKNYSHKQIECEGNFVRFDGKGDPKTKTLKVYRYYGDVTIMEQALQEFAITNGYEKVILTFQS